MPEMQVLLACRQRPTNQCRWAPARQDSGCGAFHLTTREREQARGSLALHRTPVRSLHPRSWRSGVRCLEMKGTHRIGGLGVAVMVAIAACTASSQTVESRKPPIDVAPSAAPTGTVLDATTVPPQPPSSEPSSCHELGEDATSWQTLATAEAVTLQERTGDQPGVDAVVYPRPDYAGRPWSQWGQGIVLDDGRMLSAIGDHLGADGNSYLYEYDPRSRTLMQFADVLATVGHKPGDWGFGKVHAPMVKGRCGDVYVSTYWGKRRGLTFTDTYQGDVLLRLDPEGRTIENLGVILPGHGVASMASWPEGGLLYVEAADPFGKKVGAFVVLDMESGEIVFEDDDPSHGGYRSIAVDAQGRAYITWDGDGLARYDPASNTLDVLDTAMPGSVLRWATPPGQADTVYAVSRDPAVFFSISAEGDIEEIGPARGYTASMGLSPDGRTFYYVPDAHGRAWEQGTSLIAVDAATGEESVVVELNPLIETAMGLRTGGTYDVVVDPSGERVYIGLNAGNPASGDTFGEIVLAIVTLP